MAKNSTNSQQKRHKHIVRDEFLTPLACSAEQARKALETAKQKVKEYRHE